MNTKPLHHATRYIVLPILVMIMLAPSASAQESLYLSRDFLPRNTFTQYIEGPVCDSAGTLYAVNYLRTGTIGAVTPDGAVSLFAELPAGSVGNGIRIDSDERLLVVDKKKHVYAVDPVSRAVALVAGDDAMNEPNDLAITTGDVLYISDPDWSMVDGKIWRLDPDGGLTLLEDGMGTTNGIEVSPDETTLYINESMEARIWAYDLAGDGAISNKRLFHTFDEHYLDGMRCDVDGNLYVARYNHGTVAMLSPAGELIREIELTGNTPCNVAFGGPDGRTVYVTMADRRNVETFRVERPGRSWQMIQDRIPVVVAEDATRPAAISLAGNFPNPFNPATTIRFTLAESALVNLTVYAISGQTVATLADGALPPGEHTIVWKAGDMPAGVYLYRLESAGTVLTGKMTLVK